MMLSACCLLSRNLLALATLFKAILSDVPWNLINVHGLSSYEAKCVQRNSGCTRMGDTRKKAKMKLLLQVLRASPT